MSESFIDRRARVLAADPTLNVALEASAGTGKTRVLVDRYVRLIEEGSSPRHILAVTFTRKAAGEMKTRIVDELRKRPELWEEIRSRLFEIHITTIDAFCLGLLREFPLEAGLDPELVLLDEVESDRLLEEAIEEVLSEARRGRGADVRFLMARFGESALARGLRDYLKSRLVKEELLARYVERVVPKQLSLKRSLRRFSENLRSLFRGEEGLRKFLETGPPEKPPGFRVVAFALARGIDPERIESADVEEIRGYFLTGENEPRRRLPAIAESKHFRSRADYQRHRDRVLALAPAIARSYRQWLREMDFYAVRRLFELYRTGSQRFAELKARRASLDFTDVLLKSVDLLERRGEFAQSRFRLESRYHHLLIDEFQDTNEAQWRLVRALIDAWGEGSGLVQEAILSEQAEGRGVGRVQEPSLFIVGDRKQSIYGWRDARVEVMEKASRHLLRIRRGGGRRLSLRHSFRSNGSLLSFLNDLFADLPKVRGDLGWSFQYREQDHFPVGSVDATHTPVALAVAEELPRAAAAVAEEIVRLLEEEGLRPRDLAILFRNRASYRIYEDALVARGVPAYVYRGLGFFDSPEVRDVQALVRFLAEPGSELRASELARSRFVGLSDGALVRLARARSPGSPQSPISRWLSKGEVEQSLPASSEDASVIERAARLVPRWLDRVDRVPPTDLLEQILAETDYPAWLVGEQQSWENLKKVLELVRRAQNRGYLTMSRLADYLASASTEEDSPAVLEAVDAVSLMTIHAAKGLEFDSVFLVNLHQRTRADASLPRIRELADGRVEVRALDLDEGEPDHLPNRVEEEEKRLLYVALTRARRNLVLSTVLSRETRPGRTLFDLLPRSFQQAFRDALATEKGEIRWRSHHLRVLRPTSGREYRQIKIEPSYRVRLAPLSSPERKALAGEDRKTPSLESEVRGAVHRLLELAPDEPGLTAAATSALAEQGSEISPDVRKAAARAARLYRRLRQQEELERALASGEVLRGVRFALGRAGGVARGSIDCLVVGPTKATVIDFAVGSARKEDRRRLGMHLEAAKALFPNKGIGALLFQPDSTPIAVAPPDSRDSGGLQFSLF